MKMKVFAIIFFVTTVTALPQTEASLINFEDERIITGPIINAIEDISQSIKDAGLDPYHIEKQNVTYSLPVPIIFNFAAFVEELLSTGLSDIVIYKINYGIISSRLSFDIELPLIDFGLDAAWAEGTVFGNKFDIKTSGKAGIYSTRFIGQMRVNISIISGISVSNLVIKFHKGKIVSDLNVVAQGEDYSDKVNKFINTTIPETVERYNDEINKLLEIILLDLINSKLQDVRYSHLLEHWEASRSNANLVSYPESELSSAVYDNRT